MCMCMSWLLIVCVYCEGTVNIYTNHELLYTHHEEDAEVGQFSEEILHAHRMRVKGKKAAYVLIKLLHVLVHGGQFFILLPGMLAEAVGRTESRKKRENHHHHHLKHKQKATVISDMTPHKCVHL